MSWNAIIHQYTFFMNKKILSVYQSLVKKQSMLEIGIVQDLSDEIKKLEDIVYTFDSNSCTPSHKEWIKKLCHHHWCWIIDFVELNEIRQRYYSRCSFQQPNSRMREKVRNILSWWYILPYDALNTNNMLTY